MKFLDLMFPYESYPTLTEGRSYHKTVAKWFARRLSAIPRLQICGTTSKDYFQFSHKYFGYERGEQLVILDPMMGGGTTLVEGLRLGHRVIGYDINPVAYNIVKANLELSSVGSLSLDILEGTLDRGVALIPYNLPTSVFVLTTKCLSCNNDVPLIKSSRINVSLDICGKCLRVYNRSSGCPIHGSDYQFDENYSSKILICAACGGSQTQKHPVNIFRIGEINRKFHSINPELVSKVTDPVITKDVVGGLDKQLSNYGYDNYSHLYIQEIHDWIRRVVDYINNMRISDEEKGIISIALSCHFAQRLSNLAPSISNTLKRGRRAPHKWFWQPGIFTVENPQRSIRDATMLIRAAKLEMSYTGPIYERVSDIMVSTEYDEDADAVVRLSPSQNSSKEIPRVVDLIVTDPPYYEVIQYGDIAQEICEFLKLFGVDVSVDKKMEATASWTKSGDEYSNLLSEIFANSGETLKDGGYLTFTYHSYDTNGWLCIFRAIENAGFRISQLWPYIGESWSNKKGRIDCVFVCRRGVIERRSMHLQEDIHNQIERLVYLVKMSDREYQITPLDRVSIAASAIVAADNTLEADKIGLILNNEREFDLHEEKPSQLSLAL